MADETIAALWLHRAKDEGLTLCAQGDKLWIGAPFNGDRAAHSDAIESFKSDLRATPGARAAVLRALAGCVAEEE